MIVRTPLNGLGLRSAIALAALLGAPTLARAQETAAPVTIAPGVTVPPGSAVVIPSTPDTGEAYAPPPSAENGDDADEPDSGDSDAGGGSLATGAARDTDGLPQWNEPRMGVPDVIGAPDDEPGDSDSPP